MELNDNFPKCVVTMDEMDVENVHGVEIIHLMDFFDGLLWIGVLLRGFMKRELEIVRCELICWR